MGNSVAYWMPSLGSRIGTIAAKDDRVLRLVKMDGKILELKAPILVKDVLVNFSGCGISASTKASQHLPLDYVMQIGQVYYFVPLQNSEGTFSHGDTSSTDDAVQGTDVRRIKVLITKQQLQQLLTKKLSVEQVLSGFHKETLLSVDSPGSWKPKLEAIPEGS